jgi:peptidoglycan/xylan/chitin deacetylase (PgdA/CDA1 family)
MRTWTSAGAAATMAVGGATAVMLPSALSLGTVRAALTPRLVPPLLSGLSDRRHVALTFDDGPDLASTPAFLDLLDRLDVRATFFVLGQHLGDRSLVREMAGAGHEIGVHGWDHRPVAGHSPRSLRDGILRTRDLVEDATGRPARWYRPPYGLVTLTSWWAARRAGLDTVLWTAWGRDWEGRATVASVAQRVQSQLVPGGTVLLHDSDRTSAPDSWHAALGATEQLVPAWRAAGLDVGPLAEHWADTSPERPA